MKKKKHGTSIEDLSQDLQKVFERGTCQNLDKLESGKSSNLCFTNEAFQKGEHAFLAKYQPKAEKQSRYKSLDDIFKSDTRAKSTEFYAILWQVTQPLCSEEYVYIGGPRKKSGITAYKHILEEKGVIDIIPEKEFVRLFQGKFSDFDYGYGNGCMRRRKNMPYIYDDYRKHFKPLIDKILKEIRG